MMNTGGGVGLISLLCSLRVHPGPALSVRQVRDKCLSHRIWPQGLVLNGSKGFHFQ